MLNVHAHVLALDGVYVRQGEGGPLVFQPLPTPTRAEVADVARRTAERIETILRAHGRSLDPELCDDEPSPVCLDEPGLAACYAAAAQGVSVTGDRAGQPTLRLVVSQDPPPSSRRDGASEQPVALVRGVNVHAKQLVDGRDRRQLERLCKYITRPPVAQQRLEQRADGRIGLHLKNIWKDGTRALVFEPFDLLTRLVAAVPPPHFHLLRYFGVLSSHSALRAEVVPNPPVDLTQSRPPPCQADPLSLSLLGAEHQGDHEADDDAERRPPRSRWGWLLKHVFSADVDSCSRCGGPMRWVEAATTADAIARLMAKHGLAPRPPPPRRRPRGSARAVGQLDLPLGT